MLRLRRSEQVIIIITNNMSAVNANDKRKADEPGADDSNKRLKIDEPVGGVAAVAGTASATDPQPQHPQSQSQSQQQPQQQQIAGAAAAGPVAGAAPAGYY